MDREELASMRDEMDSDAQRLERTFPTEPQIGTSANGTVQVVVSPQGAVAQITVRDAWRKWLSVEELGPAIVDAYTAATTTFLEQWGTNTDEDQGRPDPQPRPVPPLSESYAGQLASAFASKPQATDGRAMAELARLLREANENVGEMIQALDEQTSQVFSGADDGEFVKVSLGSAGQLVGVTFHHRWLAHRTAATINEYLARSLTDAHRKVAEHSVEALTTTRLGEITALLSNPQRLVEWLGN